MFMTPYCNRQGLNDFGPKTKGEKFQQVCCLAITTRCDHQDVFASTLVSKSTRIKLHQIYFSNCSSRIYYDNGSN